MRSDRSDVAELARSRCGDDPGQARTRAREARAGDAEHLLVVSDADGMLLSSRGDPGLRNRAADDMNLVGRALWSEAGAGKNAVGTALAAEPAVQVFAAEHFTQPVQCWTRAAAPVFDPDGG